MCLLPHVDNVYRCGQSATVDLRPLREMLFSRKALPPWHFAVHSDKGEQQMTEEDRQLIKDARAIETKLHQEILARISAEVADMLELQERLVIETELVMGERLPPLGFKPSEGMLALRRDVGRAEELLG